MQDFRTRLTILAFRAPSVVVLVVLVAFPIGYAINLSFRKYSLLLTDSAGQWNGLSNWARMATDAEFWHSMLITGIFTGTAVTIETILGVALGLWLASLKLFGRIVAPFILVPMIVTPLVAGLIFNFALNPQFGYLNRLLRSLGLVDANGVLGDPSLALAGLIAVDVWAWTPFIALMVMAARRAMEPSVFEAASLDGASRWQVFRRVTLPLLTPILVIALLFRIQDSLREFDKVYILTSGGPGQATMTSDLFIYRLSFKEFDLSYGATTGLVTFAFVFLLSIILYRIVERQ